jgi:hypothetical protein
MNFDSGRIARVVQVIDTAGVAAMVLAIGVACVVAVIRFGHGNLTSTDSSGKGSAARSCRDWNCSSPPTSSARSRPNPPSPAWRSWLGSY